MRRPPVLDTPPAGLAEPTFGEATIKTDAARILSKLGLRDRTQAVVFAYESGLERPRR